MAEFFLETNTNVLHGRVAINFFFKIVFFTFDLFNEILTYYFKSPGLKPLTNLT